MEIVAEQTKSEDPVGSAREPPAAGVTLEGLRQEFARGAHAAFELCRRSTDETNQFQPFEAFEKEMLLLALRATEGNQLRASRLLGINRSTLRKRMHKHSIRVETRVSSLADGP